MSDDITELKIASATHAEKIAQIVERMDSHFNDTKQQHQKIFNKLDQMPDEDRMVRLFAQEGEKLARGLIKRDDEQQEDIDGLKNNQKYVAGFGAGAAGVLTIIWNIFSK
jgi:hypothetical protein